jgi:hypothetical protein
VSGKGTRGDVAVLIFAIAVGIAIAIVWKLVG